MRWFYLLPVLSFLALVGIFAGSLIRSASRPPEVSPSALVDEPAPLVALPPLDAKSPAFGSRDLASGHVTVLNVWASWCIPCRAEMPALSQLAALKDVRLFGLVYKDTPAKARAFLEKTGDPYSRIDLDRNGRAGAEWGLQGIPETFVIDGKGIVRLRYAGPLAGNALGDIVLPAIEHARHEG